MNEEILENLVLILVNKKDNERGDAILFQTYFQVQDS